MNKILKSFINYFSLGFDARVGFGFDKSRSKCRCFNSCLYFWEGCKKHCFRKPIPVNGFIDSFLAVKLEKDITNPQTDLSESLINQTVIENEAPKELIFQTVQRIKDKEGITSEHIKSELKDNKEIDWNINSSNPPIKIGNKTCISLLINFKMRKLY